MRWDFEISPTALKNLADIGPSSAEEIISFLEKRVRGTKDPSAFGKPLRGEFKGYWRYRVRAYRLLCRLENHRVVVVVVTVGHRSTVYDN